MAAENHNDLVNELTAGAQEYLEESLNDENLLELAAESWSYAETSTSQARPTVDDVEQLIRDVVQGVLQDITGKYLDLSVVTLSIVTDMFLAYMDKTLGWNLPVEFTIAKKMIIALIYRRLLKEIGKRV